MAGGIICEYAGSLVESLNAMTVAESVLEPHHTLELARGHSRMQVWSSADGGSRGLQAILELCLKASAFHTDI